MLNVHQNYLGCLRKLRKALVNVFHFVLFFHLSHYRMLFVQLMNVSPFSLLELDLTYQDLMDCIDKAQAWIMHLLYKIWDEIEWVECMEQIWMIDAGWVRNLPTIASTWWKLRVYNLSILFSVVYVYINYVYMYIKKSYCKPKEKKNERH